MLALGSLACISGRGPDPNQCSLDVTGLEEWEVGSKGVDAAFRVRGTAGSRAIVMAKRRSVVDACRTQALGSAPVLIASIASRSDLRAAR